jgi:uncharacterized protein YndB with AHSA1/START domain
MNKVAITVQTTINAPISMVWDYWTIPEHIKGWAFASDDWEAPEATNDVRAGGKFKTVMSSKDKKEAFDFTGTYTAVTEHEHIEYVMDGEDKRHVRTDFREVPGGVLVTQVFDPEHENPLDMQRTGWQGILDNFKKYVESQI